MTYYNMTRELTLQEHCCIVLFYIIGIPILFLAVIASAILYFFVIFPLLWLYYHGSNIQIRNFKWR